MAISISFCHWPSVSALIFFFFLSAFQAGIAQNPQEGVGAAGAISNQYLPGGSNNQYQSGNGNGNGGNNGNQYQPGNGNGNGNGNGKVYGDADNIFSKALECFDDKQIYSSCNEAFRLSATGDLHVPQQSADEFCTGPCVSETHFVLDCIQGIMSNFKFYNEATIFDVKQTIKTGCEDGPSRGDFNVAEHVQEDNYGNAWKICSPFSVSGLIVLITAWFLNALMHY